MTKTNKNCNDCVACNHIDAKVATMKTDVKEAKTFEKSDLGYSFYSNILNKPFKSLSELAAAEAAYLEELKIKEDKATKKKADAQKVEDAFKALNAARKEYKEKLTQLTTEYAESLENLKKAFDIGKKDIQSKLAEAEDTYSKALKEFTDKYDQYHFSFKGDDFETTISGTITTNDVSKKASDVSNDIWNLFFGW